MFNTLFKNNKPLIGMIHLPPLPGYPECPGMDYIVKKAINDLQTLEKAGFDGALVENDNDQPHQINVTAQIKNSFESIMKKILENAKIPVGMEIIYDMVATVESAYQVNSQFVRLDVFVDNVETKWGKIHAQYKKINKIRDLHGDSKLIVVTDIQVKHAKMLEKKIIEESARQAISSRSDGIIVTGTWTGIAPTIEKVKRVKKAVGDFPVIIGSGLDLSNAKRLLAISDGAIVGSSIKSDNVINYQKALKLSKLHKLINNN